MNLNKKSGVVTPLACGLVLHLQIEPTPTISQAKEVAPGRQRPLSGLSEEYAAIGIRIKSHSRFRNRAIKTNLVFSVKIIFRLSNVWFPDSMNILVGKLGSHGRLLTSLIPRRPTVSVNIQPEASSIITLSPCVISSTKLGSSTAASSFKSTYKCTENTKKAPQQRKDGPNNTKDAKSGKVWGGRFIA